MGLSERGEKMNFVVQASVVITVDDILEKCSNTEDRIKLAEGLLLKLKKEYARNLALHSEYYEKYLGKNPELERYQKNCKKYSKLAVDTLDTMLRIFNSSFKKGIVGYHEERGYTGTWYWQKKKKKGEVK